MVGVRSARVFSVRALVTGLERAAVSGLRGAGDSPWLPDLLLSPYPLEGKARSGGAATNSSSRCLGRRERKGRKGWRLECCSCRWFRVEDSAGAGRPVCQCSSSRSNVRAPFPTCTAASEQVSRAVQPAAAEAWPANHLTLPGHRVSAVPPPNPISASMMHTYLLIL